MTFYARQRNHHAIIEALEKRRLLSTYVVATTGSDSSSGSSASPWRTLQKAANSVVAGDTVIVHPGTYTGFVLGWDFAQDGTANAPIRFSAESGVVINTRNSKTGDGINLEGTDYVIVEGFRIAPTSGDPWRAGIRSVQNSHAIIRNNTVQMRSDDRYGIFSSFTTDLLVEGNDVSGTDNSGLYTSNSALRPIIRGNTVHDVGGNGVHFNGDISQGGTGVINQATVERNTIYNAGAAAGGSAINMDGVQNSYIQNNLLYNNHAKGIALYRIDGGDASKNNLIVHNTVIQAADATGYALTIKNTSTGNQVFNNILLSANFFNGALNIAPDSSTGLGSDYNIVTDRLSTNDGDSSMSLSDWQSLTGQDPHSVASDGSGLFVNLAQNDHHLTATSIAVDRGTAAHTVSNDHDVAARPSGGGVDVGAYEYQAVLQAPVATPTGLRAVLSGATSAKLTWNDLATNETNYLIRAKPGPRGKWYTVSRRGANAISFNAKGLTPGLKYYFTARAYNATDHSSNSTYASVTLPNVAASVSSAAREFLSDPVSISTAAGGPTTFARRPLLLVLDLV